MDCSGLGFISAPVREIKTEILVHPYEPAERPLRLVTWNNILVLLFAIGWLAAGCAASTAPTFNKQVAPILFAKCVKCHRPGEMASAKPLLSYDDVRPLVNSIKQKVLAREMPPWPVDPNKSLKFRNDQRLSRWDIETLISWVDAGAPKGNNADLPPVPRFADGWMHPQGLTVCGESPCF